MSEKSKNGTAAATHGDYAVGKGKPPKAHQFKAGQSGNPKGRPKNSRSISQGIKQYLDGSMTVRTAGGTKKMARRDILVHSLYERAVKGDNRSAAILLQHDLMQKGAEGDLASALEAEFTANDDAIILSYADRIRGKGEP